MNNLINITYDIIIFLLIIFKIHYNKEKLKFLFIIVSIYIISLNIKYILDLYEIKQSFIQLYIIKILIIILLYNKKIFRIIFTKKMALFIFIIGFMLLSDIINLKFHIFYYFNYLIYILIISNIYMYNFSKKELEKTFISFAYFFGLSMLIILLVKFSLTPSLVFRDLRLHSIFATSDEDAGFFLMFLVIIFFNTKNEIFKNVVLFIGIFLLVFALGTKTAILTLFFIIIIYFKKRISFAKLLILSVVIFMSWQFMYQMVFKDIMGAFSYSNLYSKRYENTLTGRIYGIWLPSMSYVLLEKPLFGFGNKGWNEVTTKARVMGGYMAGNFYMRSPHNIFVFYFAEWGILGVTALVYIFFIVTRNLYILSKNDNTNSHFILSLYLSWIAFVLTSLSANVESIGWIILSLYFPISHTMLQTFKKKTIVTSQKS